MLERLRAFLARACAGYRATARVSLWLPAAVVLTFAVIEQFDAFGLHEAMERRSEQATLRIVSPFYTPSRDVAVVLIDDEYLKAREVGWPLRFAEQGRLLRQIASAGPSVILVDFVYPHVHGDAQAGTPRDDIESLLNPLLSSSDEVLAHVPIVFTAMALPLKTIQEEQAASAKRMGGSVHREFEFCPEDAAPAVPSVGIFDEESLPPPLFGQTLSNGRGRFRVGYIRWSRCGDEYPLMLGGSADAPTPVFAAFRAYCESPEHSKACAAANPWDRSGEYRAPMIVRPGAFPTPEQKFAYSDAVCQHPMREAGVPRSERFLAALQQLTLGMFGDLRRSASLQLSLPCPAVTVLPLSQLQGVSRDTWNELLKDKAVVLGADISGIPDLIDSPVHGQIPGAVWHGMALDNLVALKSNYLAQRHAAWKTFGGFALLLLFAYAFPYILRALELKRIKVGRAWVSFTLWMVLAITYWGFGDGWAALFCLGIGVGLDLTSPSTSAVYLLGVAVAATISAQLLEWGIPPGNWLGMLLVAAAFAHTMKAYCKASERKLFPADLSVLRALFFAVTGLPDRRQAHVSDTSAKGD
ncbi:MAG TPA: CHASE2 domain-containing protein [Steroidobacteraceae bacterium]|nr:CHASE2 domain-containing protein [Steroidobacteraceae bacterium]